jgi:manganese transport protein
MSDKVGSWGAAAMAVGLFAAGFSSAITAPYAASIISTTVFGATSTWKVRLVWGSVLLTGFAFGISGVRPIPVILAVQAINGLILPLLTVYLIFVVNDARIVTRQYVPGAVYNLVLLSILFIVLLISLNNVDRSLIAWFGLDSPHLILNISLSAIGTLLVAGWLVRTSARKDGEKL